MVYVPIELVNYIFAELEDQDPTLEVPSPSYNVNIASCSLVCRAWRDLATSYLFRDIRFSFSYNLNILSPPNAENDSTTRTRGRWTLLCAKDDTYSSRKHGPEMPYKTFEQFASFVKGSAQVQRSLRRLRLYGYPLDDATEDEWTIPPHDITSLINTLPNLHSLRLTNVAPSPSASYINEDSPVAHALMHLCIDFDFRGDELYIPYTQVDFARLLACFGEVGELYIDQTDTDGEDIGLFENLLHLRPRVLTLTGQYNASVILRCMSHHEEVLGAVRALRILGARSSAMESIASFAGSCMARVLEKLLIFVDTHPPLNPMDLSTFSALKVLTLNFEYQGYDRVFNRDMLDAMVPFLLQSGLSPSKNKELHSLILQCRFEYSPYSYIDDLGDLGNNLLDAGLKDAVERLNLKRIVVEFVSILDDEEEMAQEIWTKLLPKSYERGYLHFGGIVDDVSLRIL